MPSGSEALHIRSSLLSLVRVLQILTAPLKLLRNKCAVLQWGSCDILYRNVKFLQKWHVNMQLETPIYKIREYDIIILRLCS